MTSNPTTFDPQRLVDAYIAIWSEPDGRQRRLAIAELWTDGAVEYVEGVQFRGHDELDARVTHAYAEFVGSGKYRVTRDAEIARFDRLITLTIHLVPDSGGAPAWSARVFLVVDDDGRIREDYQLTTQPLAA